MYTKRPKAFTLAEVLITLGIIGVIASITIPNLIQSYKKTQVESELKSVLATLQGAMNRSIVDNGPPTTWGITNTDTAFFNTYFLPYLQVMKSCGSTTTNVCRRQAYSANDLTTTKNIASNGIVMGKFFLKNGVGIIPDFGGTTLDSSRKGKFYIDTSHGDNNKLILGKNVFAFNLIITGDKYYITGSLDYPAPTNTMCKYSTATLADYCTQGYVSAGFTQGIACTAMIECNGWKIPDEYPIKF